MLPIKTVFARTSNQRLLGNFLSMQCLFATSDLCLSPLSPFCLSVSLSFSLQLHLIHWNTTMYHSIDEAVGKKNGIVIIALFVQVIFLLFAMIIYCLLIAVSFQYCHDGWNYGCQCLCSTTITATEADCHCICSEESHTLCLLAIQAPFIQAAGDI